MPLVYAHEILSQCDIYLLKVNKVFFQYSDARQRKGLLMAPLSQGAELCDVTSCHATWSCLLSVGNALSTAYLFHFEMVAILVNFFIWLSCQHD